MKKILICWVGATDLKSCESREEHGPGPIANAVTAEEYKEIALINDYPKERAERYVEWLKEKTTSPVTLHCVNLNDPTDFEGIYKAASDHILAKQKEHGKETPLTFHLSPGTSQMSAVWIILSASKFRAELIKSSREQGVQVVNLPFEIAADYIPDLLRQRDKELEKLAAGVPSGIQEFKDILHRSKVMQRIIHKAQRVAIRSIPVLIEGDSGTGKELLARAIHQASPRKEKPFIAVNCGAISPELIESELFGHKKGAFTGAEKTREGHFEAASGGTLFLDEIGELPQIAQVKLLRVLQEKEVTRLGTSTPIQIDVRIIAATNKSLLDEITEGRFREDLFYRLAVAVLKLPPLRNREGDLSLLTDRLLEVVNVENEEDPTYEHKNISASARNLILQHSWPGNVRELLNTLHRAAVWSIGPTITEEDMEEAILPQPKKKSNNDGVFDSDLGNGVDLQSIMSNVATHYLKLAMKTTGSNKSKAASLLGISNYQTLTNWLKKYGLE
ncbi:MAG: transcriptional regulator with PAS, ATPase and Fis domain [Desulforhopalus sp.]|jgi:transcriptional regulator with PAS, ATPase and Fis domain